MIRRAALGFGTFAIEQRLSSRETVFDAVPMIDRRFAKLPAKKYYLRAEHAGKIDQPVLHSFTDAAVTVDRFDPLLHLRDQPRDLTVFAQPVHQIRRFRIELLLADYAFARAFQAPDILEDLLDQRPQ